MLCAQTLTHPVVCSDLKYTFRSATRARIRVSVKFGLLCIVGNQTKASCVDYSFGEKMYAEHATHMEMFENYVSLVQVSCAHENI